MGRAQRTAGTATFWDVLRRWAGYGRTTEQDLADLAAGVPLTLVVYPLDAPKHRRYVTLAATDEARASLEAVIGSGPHRVFRADRPAAVEQDFRMVEGTDAHGSEWRVAIPRVDVPVLRAALRAMWPPPERRRA
ncbi:MAG: hypothetical protein AAGC49_09220 [Brevundimonas sp.]